MVYSNRASPMLDLSGHKHESAYEWGWTRTIFFFRFRKILSYGVDSEIALNIIFKSHTPCYMGLEDTYALKKTKQILTKRKITFSSLLNTLHHQKHTTHKLQLTRVKKIPQLH